MFGQAAISIVVGGIFALIVVDVFLRLFSDYNISGVAGWKWRIPIWLAVAIVVFAAFRLGASHADNTQAVLENANDNLQEGVNTFEDVWKNNSF